MRTTESAADEQEPRTDGADGCGSVNQYTKGTEFYGDTGIFPFLARLRRYAQSQTKRRDQPQGISIVSYLHNSDYPVSATSPEFPQSFGISRPPGTRGVPSYNHLPIETSRPIESRCITLFFSNLHLIHPVLDKSEFLARCKLEVWTGPGDAYQASSCGFQAVYYAVLALGAIVASEDDFASELPDTRLGTPAADARLNDVQSPSTLAKLFFERSKASLGDIFDVSSLDTTQALFLLSVFCQNALKPHSCYLFSGMAARTAIAIGLPNAKHGTVSGDSKYLRRAVLTWWCIYMHEVEMCCASGRDSSLKSPVHYDLPLPNDDCTISIGGASDTTNAFISVTVSIANLLKQASEELYQGDSITLSSCSVKAHELNRALERWRDDISSPLNYTKVSLTEPERISKQKTVLKLRYLSARILIYRKFVETWSTHPEIRFRSEVNECLNAARSTIQLLYETYLHRPYFRTWWYNTTYLLNASMITLYVYFIGAHLVPTSDLFQDVEKALDVFAAMGSVVVARRCAKLIREIYDAAKVVHQSRSASSNSLAHGSQKLTTMGQTSCAQAEQASFVDNSEGPSGHDFPLIEMVDDFGDNNDIFPAADMILDFGFGDAFWNIDGDIDVDVSGGKSLQHDNVGYNAVPT
ncbi:uncharacterized protein N0V89_011310 [Didymosphaeria variabile]|uniref:Xylanolytic transcriptional activator regulatory domain-containing protein n=1 Tax=Didymosphaeria variabile TaxID=1932322 RepID=A0A9W8XEI6_9PLEO|nr:uncharacterized protein N0V89_011310 [Didymosphaeria variabile]KAJ4347369.1 hypothetical protein N0V89_011310 [Didymosphaeria variabile]